MSNLLYPVTNLDAPQVTKATYDEDTQAVRTITTIATPPALEVAIDANNDSIAIGKGSDLVDVTTLPGTVKALKVDVVQSVSTSSAPVLTTRIDEFNSFITYVGKASVGLAENSPGWQISRIFTTESTSSVLFANGSVDFNVPWTSRASVTYS